MTIDFSAYPNADDALKERTERFFERVQNTYLNDAISLELVHEGICLEARDDTKGCTALVWAALNNRPQTLQALIAAGANLEARDNNGNTALIKAASQGHAVIVRALLAAGANINARDDNGDTALMMAAYHERSAVVQMLLAAGANINVRDRDDNTVLTVGKNPETQPMFNPSKWYTDYDEFIAHGTAPQSAAEMYRLLTVTPLADAHAPVDYTGNIQKIFAHAQWSDKAQAADILKQMQRDGRINAQTADSLLGTAFPEQLHAARIQRNSSGIAR